MKKSRSEVNSIRQKIRKLLLLLSMFLFPITLYYFSPALIINAGLDGVVSGSFIVFVCMLISGVFFGRLFCSYLCPAGWLQDCACIVNDKPPKQGRKNYIKYGIWIVWIAVVVFCYVHKGQILKIDFFYQTEHGISVTDIYGYIIYYGIILLILLPSLIGGTRAFCHYFCWMALFMVVGTKLRQLFHMPGLHIAIDNDKCVSCHHCKEVCPMCIDISDVAQRGDLNMECINCGVCVDSCLRKALTYSMRGKQK
ncbi:MAG: 4Fe-4S binding protein [Oscillospiraceae bacterium]|nr:4Fe-4S binding protein [Oscillospiraceae bacterium]